MKTRLNHQRKWLCFILLAAVLGATLISSPVMARGGSGGCGGCGDGGGSTIPLSDYEKGALNTAIDEEYYAKAVYEKVIDTFGPIEPFTWIIRDERMHVNWVARLLSRYGLPVPPDRWSGNITMEFTSKEQACRTGAQAEFDNSAFYDAALPGITHDDIVSTFIKLRDVSRYRHLPAFQRWADIYGAAGE